LIKWANTKAPKVSALRSICYIYGAKKVPLKSEPVTPCSFFRILPRNFLFFQFHQLAHACRVVSAPSVRFANHYQRRKLRCTSCFDCKQVRPGNMVLLFVFFPRIMGNNHQWLLLLLGHYLIKQYTLYGEYRFHIASISLHLLLPSTIVNY